MFQINKQHLFIKSVLLIPEKIMIDYNIKI